MLKGQALLITLTIMAGIGLGAIQIGVFHSRAGNGEHALPDASPIPSTRAPDLDSRVLTDRVKRYCANAYEVTCENSTKTTVDPTGRVDLQISGEVRALRVLRQILGEHSDWSSKQVEDELVSQIYTEKRVKRIETAYRWVKAQLHAIIERQDSDVFSPAEKKLILSRIDRVELNMPPPASNYADAADVFTKNTIYYERTSNDVLRLRVGGAYLLNISSWFNLVFSLAHEFSHSIDPCEMTQNAILPAPYKGLVSCFVQVGWVEPSRSTCGENEQVSEVFADWMAAEVLSSALQNSEKEYTQDQRIQSAVNSVRDLCEDAVTVDVLSMQNHQTPAVRIQKMFGENPKIRKSVGCTPEPATNYCSFSLRK